MTIEEIQKSTEFQTLIAECTAYDYKEESRPKSWPAIVSKQSACIGQVALPASSLLPE